jgi:hypothetical protein
MVILVQRVQRVLLDHEDHRVKVVVKVPKDQLAHLAQKETMEVQDHLAILAL